MFAALQIVEAQAAVDGEPLGLALVDEGDAREVIVERGHQRIDVVAQVFAEELALRLVAQVHIAHLDALFLRPPVVVLGLHLHKLEAGDAVGAEAYLLTVRVAVLVGRVHIELPGVEIRGVVLQVASAVDVLHIVVLLGHLQKPFEFLEIGHKLGIRTIHQFHAAHLLQCDRIEGRQKFINL